MSAFAEATAKVSSKILEDLERIKKSVQEIDFDAFGDEEEYPMWSAFRGHESDLNNIATIFEMWQARFKFSRKEDGLEATP